MFKILGSIFIMFGGFCVVYLVHDFYHSGAMYPWEAVIRFFVATYVGGFFIMAGELMLRVEGYRISKENLLRIFGMKVH